MSVQERDESRYTYSLMGEHEVRLRFDWTEAIPLPYGSYIEYNGRTWKLYEDYIPAQRDGVAEYDVGFCAPEIELKNFTAFYMSQGAMEAEWDLTGTIAQFAREIEANLRRVGSSLTIQPSSYDRLSTAKHIDVDKLSIYELLGRIAEVFEIEWWLDGSEIRLGRIPEGSELVARIGELASAYTPSGEANTLIRRLYAFGSTRNLTDSYRRQAGATSRIGEPRLRMPEGTEYVQGVANGIEDVQYFDDVYPRYVGRIASVSSRKSGDSTIYKISDSALTIKQSYILEGQTLRAQFTSGALNGMEFDLAIVSGGYEIVPSESYGQTLPAGNLVPAVGDEYVPFGFDISMVGDEYVPRAEQELLQRATEWLRANNEDRRDVEVACNPVWVYERGVALRLGQSVRLVDATPTGDKAGRITKIEYPLYCPQLATLIVGNAKPTTRLERLAYEARKEAEGAKSYAEDKQREAISHSERLFSQATETMRGLVAVMGERYGGVINPIAVKTMQLLAGDERLQFVFVEGESDRRAKPLNVEWQAGAKSVRIALPSWLMHYTLPESRTLAPRATEALPVWSLPEYQSPALSEADKPYYLYAIASKSERTGYFATSTEPREDSATDYALLVGMLSSEDADGARSFAPLHGFSEVLPGRITTDRIVASGGVSYFDLLTGRINGQITITNEKGETIMGTTNDKGQTLIDGGLVLSQIIGAVDKDGVLRSYISGDSSKPAIVAGLSDDGTTSNVRIEHNGDAKFGQAMIDGRTGQYSFINDKGAQYMRIGGAITSLDTLNEASGFSATHNINESFSGFDMGEYQEDIPIQISKDGTSLTIDLSMSFSAYANSDVSDKIRLEAPNGYVSMSFRVINERGEELWSEELTSPRSNIRGGRKYNKVLSPLPAGRYTIRCAVMGNGTWNASFRGSAHEKWVGDVREMAIGEAGMSLFYGRDRLLYAQRDGEPFLTIRGATFLNGYPLGTAGMLVCGDVAKNGNGYRILWQAGIKTVTSIEASGSELIIRHNIGHTQYMITATNNLNPDIVRMVHRDSNYCRIVFRYGGGGGYGATLPQAFEFVINGKIV